MPNTSHQGALPPARSSSSCVLRASALVVLLALLCAACAEKGGEDAPTALDASPAPSLVRVDGGYVSPDLLVDGELPGVSGPLQVNLQINGKNGACGACGVVIAQVQGGKAPYEYKWNDSSLSGPGPHTVCPSASTSYAVEVSDSSGMASVELSADTQYAQASGEFTCDADSGAWGGCFPPPPPAPADAGLPEGSEVCKTLKIKDPILGIELGEAPVGISTPVLGDGFEPGKTYEFLYDQLLLTFSLSKPVTVQIFGSDSPCGTDQLFGTWTLDGRLHQGYCFTPDRAWKYTRVDIDIGDTLLYLDFVPALSTLCRGCSSTSK